MMKQTARAKFSSFGLSVPQNWQNPSGDPGAQHYGMSMKDADKATAPDTTVPPLFTPASLVKCHTDIQKELTSKIGSFIDTTCEAICSAWSQWQSTAMIVGVMINGPVASLGQVTPIPLLPFILASAAKNTPAMAQYSMTIANVVSLAWTSYTASIKIPGLPWYPAFAAVPSPMAPPMPNTPTPLMALTQVTASLSTDALKGQMVGMHPPGPDGKPGQYSAQIFEAVSFAVNTCFTMWQGTTMITNVMGTGPVPTFAPPYVPVGPVVAGTNIPAPGCFT